jgi:hypothetical protein
VLHEAGTPWLRLVAADLELFDRAIDVWGSVARAEVCSRRYLLDGATSTLDDARAALDRIRQLEIPPDFGDPDPLLSRVEQRLRTPADLTLLGRRLAEIESATDPSTAGAGSRAAELLRALLDAAELSKAVDRHWPRIGKLATAMRAFGHDPAAVRVRWGGDGRWRPEEREGRWAWVTTPRGPCVYFDVEGAPEVATLRFEVFAEEEGRVDVHYNSVDPSSGERSDYRAAPPVPLTGAGEWRIVSVPLKECAFMGRQNLDADFRLIPNRRGVAIRAVELDWDGSATPPEEEP